MAVTRLGELKLAIVVVMEKQILCSDASGCLMLPIKKKCLMQYFDEALLTQRKEKCGQVQCVMVQVRM